ncbi:uncharacterized protein LOC121054789 [Oryza brachyantha]|uniref:Legume lectin domain-containing protein n=1 Tax=Oryza brachyantha TaxID=4533 RepID=A0A1V1H1A3_ORYBR|nr:uncharacterized protein LOC121054789 [Oryza brachyantha]BAX25129.1 hypothetical protein [Oryza brachyantha]
MAIASPLWRLLMFLAFLHACAGGQDHGAAAAAAAVVNLSSIEAAVRDRAFQLFRRTSEILVVGDVPVLAGAGVEASATRVRSSALWADGVNATAAGFAVPPRVVPAPFARRVAIVFVRFLGDTSSWLFAAPAGYALAAPVVGLLAYDASGPNGELALRALGAPVRIEFRVNLSSAKGFNATTARCLTFAAGGGKAVATHAVEEPGPSCVVSGTGHYGVAVQVETPPSPPPPPPPVRERWWVWKVGATAGGVVAASFLVITVVAAVRWSRRRRREEMERRAMSGEELGRMAVRGSRMPSAKMVRTRPEVEEEGSPLPWRKS